MIYLCLVLVAIWVLFVIYCLFNGKNINKETLPTKNIYWALTAFFIVIALYLINGYSFLSLILMIVGGLASAIYIIIPSGYNDKGLFIRGYFFPYNKIDDIHKEYVKNYRINFAYHNRIYYVETKDEDMMLEIEKLYKKARYVK